MKDPNADPARFDVALTVCAMRLVSDLHIGRINPQHFHFGLSVQGKKYDLPRFLRERLMPAADVKDRSSGVFWFAWGGSLDKHASRPTARASRRVETRHLSGFATAPVA